MAFASRYAIPFFPTSIEGIVHDLSGPGAALLTDARPGTIGLLVFGSAHEYSAYQKA
jgi:hypothetical protein